MATGADARPVRTAESESPGPAAALQRLHANMATALLGKPEVIRLALVTLLAEGHLLIEDVPGVGKTTLARALARSLGGEFRRIQCTPDLLPSDISGITFFNQRRGEFEFRPGPIVAHVVLADEINRATPRTQSALLECMEERQVSTEGETRPLPRPFMVLATQNPIELEGTFPLPEAQLDRFFLRLAIGYPSEPHEKDIVRRFRAGSPLDELPAVVSQSELLAGQRLTREVHVADAVEDYIVRLVRASRVHASIELGASPRATLALYRASQALAAIGGRGYVLPDDVKQLAPAVLAHRLITTAQSRLRGRTAVDALNEVIGSVPVPVEEPLS